MNRSPVLVTYFASLNFNSFF